MRNSKGKNLYDELEKIYSGKLSLDECMKINSQIGDFSCDGVQQGNEKNIN